MPPAVSVQSSGPVVSLWVGGSVSRRDRWTEAGRLPALRAAITTRQARARTRRHRWIFGLSALLNCWWIIFVCGTAVATADAGAAWRCEGRRQFISRSG